MTFYIMCQVSGGVTGTRRGLMKEHDTVCTFATREEATQALPKSHTTDRGVSFNYWIVEG